LVAVRVTGIPQLIDKLGRIEDPKRNRAAIRSTVQAGATVVRKNMRSVIRSSVNERTGALYDATDSKVRVYSSGNVVAIVGVRRGRRATYSSLDGRRVVPARYFHLVDQGTRSHIQPNAHRFVLIRGRRVLVPVGPRRHPGARAANIRDKAAMRSRSSAPAAMAKRYRKRVLAEATRGA
jgi:hypothetical protein